MGWDVAKPTKNGDIFHELPAKRWTRVQNADNRKFRMFPNEMNQITEE
jgi:hypothetical protein